MSDLVQELHRAETDLAFALAQGDGYAEDEADARIRAIREAMDEQDAAEAGAL